IPELVLLGHEVVLWSPQLGDLADELRAIGCRVEGDLAAVGAVDVIHAHHASTALAARAQLPTTPMVFAAHSWILDIEMPPDAARPAALVAYNEQVAARLRASALGERVPVHRLRQPVTINGMETYRTPLGPRIRLAVAVSNHLRDRLPMLRTACERVGATLDAYTPARPTKDPQTVMMAADVVFGSGRVALEAMALARATFVFDELCSVGFVTTERYAEMESVNFTPVISEGVTVDHIVRELRTYRPELGLQARELAVRHHAA